MFALKSIFDSQPDNLGRLVEEYFDFGADGSGFGYNDHDYKARYSFDLVGNRLKKTLDRNGDGSSESFVNETTVYSYDSNDRLRRETFDDHEIGQGTIETTTFYQYDKGDGGINRFDGTGLSRKITYNGDVAVDPWSGYTSETNYIYNAQGQLIRVVVDSNGAAAGGQSITEYTYSPDGVRASEKVGTTTTQFLIDHNNHTGYHQVLEEKVGTTRTRSYTIGLDVISQTKLGATNERQLLVYDGHGSTRALVDGTGVVLELYAYDAYGNMLALPDYTSAADASTVMLYSGEWTEVTTGLQYLRARRYDPSTGRFITVDPFAGTFRDPQSLHKYLYTHGNPINGIDPSGLLVNLWARVKHDQAVAAAGVGGIARIYAMAFVSALRPCLQIRFCGARRRVIKLIMAM